MSKRNHAARRARKKFKQKQLELIAFNVALAITEKINLELVDRRVRKYLLTKDDEANIKRIGVRECPRLYNEPITITTRECADTVMRAFQPRVFEDHEDDERALILY